jgi:hypothetical protein
MFTSTTNTLATTLAYSTSYTIIHVPLARYKSDMSKQARKRAIEYPAEKLTMSCLFAKTRMALFLISGSEMIVCKSRIVRKSSSAVEKRHTAVSSNKVLGMHSG